MSKLTHRSSMEIVRKALANSGYEELLAPDVRLGDILDRNEHRESFRIFVHQLVDSSGFSIKLDEIPTEPDFTIEDVAEQIALAALPGDAGTEEPPHKKKKSNEQIS